MTTYLLKLNCETNIGGANPRPKVASEWEDARIQFPNPSLLAGGPGRSVQKGDRLIIWTHEDPNFGSGTGLTAQATAEDVIVDEAETKVRLTNVELLTPHYQVRFWPGGSSGSVVIDHIMSHRRLRSYELKDAELEEFRRIVSEFMAAKKELLATDEYMSDEQKALINDKEAIGAGFARRFGNRELRPEQAEFRAALLEHYKGRCLVSGCAIPAVLQAAHIVPFSVNVPLRNEIRNGLLLRADIHLLFDNQLLSIHPKTASVEIAPSLLSSHYKQFDGRTVQHSASPIFLKEQYIRFQAANPRLGD